MGLDHAVVLGPPGNGWPIWDYHTLARLKTLFSWALDRELMDIDPTARVRVRVKEVARDRALSDDEIRYFWAKIRKEAPVFLRSDRRCAISLELSSRKAGRPSRFPWERAC